MRVQRAYKTELDLTGRQVTACKQHAGSARWAYNWGLQVKQKRYRATKKSPTAIKLHRDLNAAINLEKLAGSLLDSLNACGADSAGTSREAGVQLSVKRGPRARKKQEQNASEACPRWVRF